MPRFPVPPADGARPNAGAELGEGGDHTAQGGAGNGPVILLSNAYSGADHVQNLLAVGTGLACTSGTGIIPLCAAAAESWRRVEGLRGNGMSRVAAKTIRGLITAQVTTILASVGRTRWCELATAPPTAAEPFLQVFPDARFVCVHRSCPDVIRAGVQASPWGLYGQGLMPYLLAYPGNSVAVLAAYWASTTEQLLAFEQANCETTYRVRYEDVANHPDQALTVLRTDLRLGHAERDGTIPLLPELPQPDTAPEAEVPAEMIPEPLRLRISRLHAELGYPPEG
jgi:hypothetical protein